jgi:TonB family protein
MRARRYRRIKVAIVFAALALLFHLFVVLPLGLLVIDNLAPPPAAAERRFDIWELSTAPPEKTAQEELEDYEPEAEPPDGEVVRIPTPRDRRKPLEKARFLAETDSRADVETKSRFRAPGPETAIAPMPQLGGRGADLETSPGGMPSGREGASPAPVMSGLAPDEGGSFSTALRAPFSPRELSLKPSREAMTGAIAGSGLDDFEDVIDGDATMVNTASWEFASFFNRVKSKVELFWKPGAEYRRRDPYGNIYGLKDRVTVLLVVLYADGQLKKLYVMDPSGAPFLDDEAYEAVEKAAPFPNVPTGLRDKKDGLVKFTFHFIVEVGSAPVVRMRRYE